MKYILPLLILPLMGCADLSLGPVFDPLFEQDQAASAPIASDGAPPPPQAARTVEQFDTTTAEQRAAAAAPASGGASLGTAVASLGDPAQPGFWVETDLVRAVSTGRITLISSGQSVEVELRPIGNGSARVSLAAWRLLELPLTDLAEIEIFAGQNA